MILINIEDKLAITWNKIATNTITMSLKDLTQGMCHNALLSEQTTEFISYWDSFKFRDELEEMRSRCEVLNAEIQASQGMWRFSVIVFEAF